ncbi:MAG: leucine-rich repeat domain-containing protein [Prevotellaceae bacterium]|jgi:hypothetical protein|nr:leucine-rich repeat domain-containing protein [Prevotellaceae bacterium]
MRKVNLKLAVAICSIAFAAAHGLSAQTIQFEGGYCVLDTIVETEAGGMAGRYVRVDFKYTLDENATMEALMTLLKNGQLVAGRNIFKPDGISLDIADKEEMKTKKTGDVSLPFFIPHAIKMKSIKFVLAEEKEKKPQQIKEETPWRIAGDTLIISGTGKMSGKQPYSYADKIPDGACVIVGDSITELIHHAFAMSKIKSVVLGAGVVKLGIYAFFNCNNLVQMEVKSAIPPKISSFAFLSTPVGKAKLIVPTGAKAAYQKAGGWKKFGIIEEKQDE